MADSIQTAYAARIPLLTQLAKALEEETTSALKGIPRIDRISFRVKGTKSFVDKATDPTNDPQYRNPLVEIEDQVAGRIIVFFVSDLPGILDRLRGTFGNVERKHARPAKDQEFGYESHHLICLIPPHLVPDGWRGIVDAPTTFELQVRTLFMHAYAEPQHDIGYKSAADLPSDIRRELAWIAASAWGADQAFDRIQRWEAGHAASGGPGSEPACPSQD
jgi:putative GTP pyrophosphokinase